MTINAGQHPQQNLQFLTLMKSGKDLVKIDADSIVVMRDPSSCNYHLDDDYSKEKVIAYIDDAAFLAQLSKYLQCKVNRFSRHVFVDISLTDVSTRGLITGNRIPTYNEKPKAYYGEDEFDLEDHLRFGAVVENTFFVDVENADGSCQTLDTSTLFEHDLFPYVLNDMTFAIPVESVVDGINALLQAWEGESMVHEFHQQLIAKKKEAQQRVYLFKKFHTEKFLGGNVSRYETLEAVWASSEIQAKIIYYRNLCENFPALQAAPDEVFYKWDDIAKLPYSTQGNPQLRQQVESIMAINMLPFTQDGNFCYCGDDNYFIRTDFRGEITPQEYNVLKKYALS